MQARELFGSDRLPTLLQYDPYVRLLEVRSLRAAGLGVPPTQP